MVQFIHREVVLAFLPSFLFLISLLPDFFDISEESNIKPQKYVKKSF